VFAGLEKSNEWIPSKICGVPLRTRVVLPLSIIGKWKDSIAQRGVLYEQQIRYDEAILKD
jgi:hypothetical protein